MIKVRSLLQGALAAALLPLIAWAGLTTQNVRNMTAVVAPDTTPSAFSFTDQTNVTTSSTITSAAVSITGITAGITCNATGGTIDKNGVGTFASSQSVVNNDTIRARHTSSASASTAVNTSVDCNGVSDTFTSTTAGGGGGGDFIHGQQFIVAGSGFGTRGDYGGAEDRLNWKRLDFESALQDDGFELDPGEEASHWVWMSSENRHARGSRWAKRWNAGNVQYLQEHGTIPTTKFFFSSWQKWNNANGKTWRIWHSEAPPDWSRPDLWVNYGTGSVASDSPQEIQFVDGGVLEPPENQWFRMDVYMREGGSGMLVDIWITGQNGNSAVYTKDYAGAGFDGAINPALGAGEDNFSTTQYWGFDDVYFDFSPARVELADTNTWAARTKSEIQDLVSWSGTSITINANAGSFTSGQTAYLYVITEALAVVGPFQVTIQ